MHTKLASVLSNFCNTVDCSPPSFSAPSTSSVQCQPLLRGFSWPTEPASPIAPTLADSLISAHLGNAMVGLLSVLGWLLMDSSCLGAPVSHPHSFPLLPYILLALFLQNLPEHPEGTLLLPVWADIPHNALNQHYLRHLEIWGSSCLASAIWNNLRQVVKFYMGFFIYY